MKCLCGKFIVYSDMILTLLTFYQLFIVYFGRRMRCDIFASAKDIRMQCLFITFLNGFLISMTFFRLGLANFIVRTFTAFEMARYTLLFTLCILYAHAVSRNIIKWRKNALFILLSLFGITLLIIAFISLDIVQK